MSEDFKIIIEKAAFLAPAEKQKYLLIFDYLDEGKKAQLSKIIADAVNGAQLINDEAKLAKSDAIKAFIAACDQAIKTEANAAMDEEEASYKDEADKLLNNL